MELSTEHQSINQYMKCRSKIYQSIEQKILMGELDKEMTIQENIHGTTVRNSDTMKACLTEEQLVYTKLVDEYRNENCQLPDSNNIRDNQQLQHKFRRLDGLLRHRYGKLRVCNIYLFSHDILQTIHKQIDNQLKKLSHDILQTIHKQIDNQLKSHNLEPRKSNVELAITNCKQRLDVLIEQFRTNEKQLQDLRNEINMELSTEHQSINQYMKCRSKIYQSIEQKILMGELDKEMTIQENIHGTTVRNSDTMKACLTEEQSVYTKLVNKYRNENCQLPDSNNIRDNQQLQHKFRRLDGLLRHRYGKIRVCNIYLFSHDILQTIHKQIDNQLKSR
ncbi:hypothetical protein MS3_00011108 [Schistosoma haematobium]|uniref:Uncharacterized protein n=1 Tax=Schistosoma haematobium TaxID=6185 RepID=A0A922LED6_SCHHA|nr:hypothetical protein MS3_00011108 [Schistosoma haematobium]KAH9580292.1 hypothetical protein MS3_00011108 [Schistosoma haematobium]